MRRSFNVRAFFIGFTSAFLCFCTVWMAAILFVRPQTSLSSSAVAPDSDASLYLPDASDCMTLLLCEDTASPNLFFLLRFQPVSGEILIFSFPDTLVLTREQVSEPVRTIFSSFGLEGIQQGLQQTFDIPTQGYLMVKRDNLPLILDSIGSTQIELQEELSLVADGGRKIPLRQRPHSAGSIILCGDAASVLSSKKAKKDLKTTKCTSTRQKVGVHCFTGRLSNVNMFDFSDVNVMKIL